MTHQYKDLNSRAGNVSISIQNNLLSEFGSIIAEFDTDRSKLIVALIKYCVDNKSNKKFKGEVLKILKNE